ncbi:transposase [Streptomyces sp. KM273126]|nr:transposase [Streptomyces sp. KM273126]
MPVLPWAYDEAIGLDLENLVVDGCLVKAPGSGQNTGNSPVDRGKSGLKRSVPVDGGGLPPGWVLAGANRNDSPLLRPTLEPLRLFGFRLPPAITVHLDADYDSQPNRALLEELGCTGRITPKGQFVPMNYTHRWVIERTNSWLNNREFKAFAIVIDRRAVVQDAWMALASAVTVIRRLLRQAWTTYRWDTRLSRRRPHDATTARTA